jgi:hypothetical protein
MVEALAELKRRQAMIDELRANSPGRFGWTVGAGFQCGYALGAQQIDCGPAVALVWGIRF